ncbi:MAG: tetratricopeptide repeat protein, partial [Chloroflexota bacterium]|nr:tetratricopeptide repeat protein [Chloroflexota bacterium]
YILDYLVEEVLMRQPPHLQTFLLQTSILDRLCGPLCDEVVGGAEGQRGRGAEETEDEADRSSPIQHPTSKIQNRNGQAMLEELERANLFIVPLDDAGQWYRYHHLFAEVLRHRLQGSAMPDGVRTLHLRAAAWYERHGLIVEAVQHSLRAEDVERSAQLIEQVALRLIGRGEARLLQQWLALLPVEVIRTRLRLSLASAWALTFTAEIDAMEAHLHDAGRLLEAGSSAEESTTERDRLGGELLALRGFVALRRQEIPAAITLFQQARARIPTDDALLSGFIAHHLGFTYRLNDDPTAAGRAFAEAGALFGRSADTRILALYPLTALAAIEEMQGRLHQAAQTHRRALELAVVGDRPLPLAGHSYIGLGRLHREWNDLPAARRYFEQGIELARQAGFDAVVAEGSTGLASVLQAQGKRDDANALIQEALDAARRWNVGGAVARIAAAGAHLWLLQGRIAAAAEWAQESRLDVDNVPQVQIGHLTLARLLLAQRRLEEAQRLLERLLPIAEAGSQMGRAIEILVLQALAHHYAGSQPAALAALQRALLLAEPEGYIRTFVDEGPAMAALLAAASRQRPRGSPASSYRPYIERLLAAFGEGAEEQRGSGTQRPGDGGSQAETISAVPVRPTPPSPVELLSSRELEVLRLIAAGKSNPEIAQALVVAISTVKAHINNIFGKLGVTSRTQAIARARELQIL